METITGNTVREDAMGCPEEKRRAAYEYQEEMRRIIMIKSIAGRMKKKGILSTSEYDDFLAKQAEKYSLDPSLLGC